MGFWEFFVAHLFDPEDDFTQKLRKSIVTVLLFPVAFVAGLFSIRSYFEYERPTHIAAGVALHLITLNFVMSYLWMRYKRHVSDIHMAITVWSFSLCFILILLVLVQTDCKGLAYVVVTLGVMTQMRTLPCFCVFMFFVQLIVDWNTSHIVTGEVTNLLTLPEPRLGNKGWVVFANYVGSTITLMACLYVFYLQIVESERRGAAQTAANEMTLRVLQRQRRYNTEEVSKILDECTDANVVDPELIQLFKQMNDNLDSYRPFLPNYLFLGSMGNAVDEDAMSAILSNDPGELTHTHTHSRSASSEDQSGPMSRSFEEGTASPKLENTTGDVSVSTEEARNVLQGDSVHFFAPATTPAVNGYRGVICHAWVELCNSEWFSTRLTRAPFSERTCQQQRNTLAVFTDALFDLAQSTKASVHSLVGDTAQLTWNVTHRVPQAEMKAVLFLLRLKQALATALPNIQLAGACCAGYAEVHNTISTSTRQQALYLDAPWLPALDACHTLAKRYKTLIVDANVESRSHQQVIVQGIDFIRYVPKVAVVPETGEPALQLHPGILADAAFEPQGFPQPAPDHFDTLLGVVGAQQEEASKTIQQRKPLCYTLAFELIKRRSEDIHDEDEWLYGDGREMGDIERKITGALMMCADGHLAQAATFVTQECLVRTRHQETQVDSVKAAAYTVPTADPSELGKRVIAFCLGGRKKEHRAGRLLQLQPKVEKVLEAGPPTAGGGGAIITPVICEGEDENTPAAEGADGEADPRAATAVWDGSKEEGTEEEGTTDEEAAPLKRLIENQKKAALTSPAPGAADTVPVC